MKLFHDILKAAVLTALFVLIAIVTLYVIEARSLLYRSDTLLAHADAVLVNINVAAENAAAASQTAKDAATEQKRYFQMSSLQTYKVITDLKGMIVRTDRSINVELVPRLSRVLDSTNGLTVQAAESLKETTESLKPGINDLNRAAASAAEALSDPHIRESLTHVDETSASLAASLKDLSGVTADLKEVADYYKKKLMTPASFWSTLAKFVLQAGSEARILFSK